MRYYLFDGAGDYGKRCAALAESKGFLPSETLVGAWVALAPRLTRKLGPEELRAPRLGVLVFHPSILPYRRGPDAIRWTVHAGERVSGVTWFWADEGLDTGPICEQEPVLLNPGESPGRAYHTRYQPAGLAALARALDGILAGSPRRAPQEEALASYEGFFGR
ncbi:MAG: formyl transferase [Planctomycetota bacterium]|nr:formyl transferase [Planctomycetota bacterium]